MTSPTDLGTLSKYVDTRRAFIADSSGTRSVEIRQKTMEVEADDNYDNDNHRYKNILLKRMKRKTEHW